MTIPVNLAIEDELSEVVLRQMLDDARRDYHVGTAYRRGGFGFLRRTVNGWNAAAKGIPFVLLTDLDDHSCPPALIQDWLHKPVHPNLIFRVAIPEVESWLLADHRNLAAYLGVPEGTMPAVPDELEDPKVTLMGLARASRFSVIRQRLVPKRNSTARVGPDYNSCLGGFVTNAWDIQAAAARSPSLARAVSHLARFVPTYEVRP